MGAMWDEPVGGTGSGVFTAAAADGVAWGVGRGPPFVTLELAVTGAAAGATGARAGVDDAPKRSSPPSKRERWSPPSGFVCAERMAGSEGHCCCWLTAGSSW